MKVSIVIETEKADFSMESLKNEIFKELMKSINRPIQLEELLQLVCVYSDVTKRQIKGTSRLMKIVTARKLLAICARRHTNASLKEIALAINKSHSSIVHYYTSMEGYLKNDEQLRAYVEEFEKLLK